MLLHEHKFRLKKVMFRIPGLYFVFGPGTMVCSKRVGFNKSETTDASCFLNKSKTFLNLTSLTKSHDTTKTSDLILSFISRKESAVPRSSFGGIVVYSTLISKSVLSNAAWISVFCVSSTIKITSKNANVCKSV